MRVIEYLADETTPRIVEVRSMGALLDIPWIVCWENRRDFRFFRELEDYLIVVLKGNRQHVIAKMEPICTESKRHIIFPPWDPWETSHG